LGWKSSIEASSQMYGYGIPNFLFTGTSKEDSWDVTMKLPSQAFSKISNPEKKRGLKRVWNASGRVYVV
jgi:hypothetical protein